MDLKEEIGHHAGKVWSTISKVNDASFTRLRAETDLRNNEIYEAVGWLAREDKIRKEGRKYRLENTNLTPEIGRSAGKVFELLEQKQPRSITEMVRTGKLKQKEVWTAIGWLAKEDKIEMDRMGAIKLKK